MEYPVFYRERQMGEAAVTDQGGRTQVEVSCRRDNGGLFRAYLLCERGEYPLGVLEPRGESMALRRTVRTGELQALGRVCRCEVRMSYPFSGGEAWEPLDAAADFFRRDNALARQLAALPGALWRRERDQNLLALPYAPDRPFPLPALFCFAQIRTIQGESYAVYRFSGAGDPVFP